MFGSAFPQRSALSAAQDCVSKLTLGKVEFNGFKYFKQIYFGSTSKSTDFTILNAVVNRPKD